MRVPSYLRAFCALAVVLLFLGPTHVWADDFDFDEGTDEGDDGEFNFDEGGEGGDQGGDDGSFDFTDGGDAQPDEPQYVADPNSATYKTLEEADGYSKQNKHAQASLLYHQVLKAEDDTAMALRGRASYELGRTLYQMGLYQSSLAQFDKVLNIGPTSEYFLPTLQWLVLISRELPGEPQRAQRIYDNYLNYFPEQVDPAILSEVGLLMGQAAYSSGMLSDAIFFFENVEEASPYYPRANFIKGVTFVRQYEGMNAVDSFKNVLRWIQEQEDMTDDMERMQELAIMSLGRVFYQVGHILWTGGERPKAVKSWNTAIKYYSSFGQSSPMWLDSLFEASWTYYRVDNFNKALGLLLTLNSPFFNDEYYPEAMLLQAQIYYTNCHYDRVMYILEEFKEVYPPLQKRLDAQLTNLIQPEDVYKFLEEILKSDAEFDPTTQQVLNAALQDRELSRLLNYVTAVDDEIAKIQGFEKGWAKHELAQALIQDLQFTKNFASVEVGRMAKARLERVADELKDLKNRALDIEIETTEKFADMAEQKGLDPTAMQAFEAEIDALMKADDEHLFWTFDGEYWKDELGYYWYYITSRCGR